MSILSRTISAVVPSVVSTAFEAVNSSLEQWAKESKAINESFSEDRVKLKVVAEKARLMTEMVQAEASLKKAATKALPRSEVQELNSLYDQMFSDQPVQPQPTVTTVELL